MICMQCDTMVKSVWWDLTDYRALHVLAGVLLRLDVPQRLVRVRDIAVLIDGRVFMDTEKSKDGPVVFTLGEKKVIEGMEASVLGMRVGETKTAQLCPEEAFGDIRADLILHIPTENIPASVLKQVHTGKLLKLTEQAQGEVLAKTERGVTVDLNHPLAGETVVFELNIVSIMPAR